MSDVSDPSNTFDSAKYRQVLGHFPTGVTVVTAMDDAGPVGLAVSSFTSVSLEPPEVLFCATKTSSSWARIHTAGRFSVNILAADQEDVCRVFASPATDKFIEIGWKRSSNGCPLIDGVLAHIDCSIGQVVDAGDHHVVIGTVENLEVLREHEPLVFYRGGFGTFAI